MSTKFQPSYWESDSFLKPYDLIIIGAGIVGLTAALFYKQKHPEARVAVLEKGFVPRGASTRNAGFACLGSITEHIADLRKGAEGDIRKRIVKRFEGLKLLKKTLGEEAIGYEPCGGYELFTSEEKFEKAASEIEHFNDLMSDLLHEDSVYEVQELEGYPVIYNRLEGALHPGKMMQELVRRVGASGVEIKWNSLVKDVTGNGVVTLKDSPGLQAKKVLFAVNAFARHLVTDLDVKPARGFVLITNEQKKQPWKGTFHHDRGYVYFRNVGNRILIGGARNLAAGEEETDHFGTNETIKNHLMEFVSDVLRLPKGWQVEQEWSGIMGFTQTKTPIVKQLDEHRFVAAGLSGMGIAVGAGIGRDAARILSQRRGEVLKTT